MRSRPAGWIPPGPVPPGAGGDPSLRPGPGETLDSLSGHWRIFQLRRGHRYSTDDLLTAWFAASHCRTRGIEPSAVLDLGCGIGSVLLLLLWSFPGSEGVGVEAQPVSAALARRSLRYNGAERRARIVDGDLRDPNALPPDRRFELVTASPPYLRQEEGRRSSLPQRGPCRFEDRGGIEAYLRTAVAHLADGGLVVWVHATRYAPQVLECARACCLTDVLWRRVEFREGGGSLISLFCAQRKGDGWRVSEGQPLAVRKGDGSWSKECQTIRQEMGFPT